MFEHPKGFTGKHGFLASPPVVCDSWEALWHSVEMHIVDRRLPTERVSFDTIALWHHMGSFFSPSASTRLPPTLTSFHADRKANHNGGHASGSPALIAYMQDFLTFLICRRQQDAKGWHLRCHPGKAAHSCRSRYSVYGRRRLHLVEPGSPFSVFDLPCLRLVLRFSCRDSESVCCDDP